MNLLPKRVAIISRLRAGNGRTVAENMARLRRLREACKRARVAYFAPHGFYVDDMDDNLPEERIAGIECGLAWLAVAQEAWIDARFGVSSGMQAEIEAAQGWGVRVVVDPECWRGVP